MSEEISRALGRIEGKMDLIIESHKRHDDDINDLKAHKNKQTGVIIGFSAVLSAFWHYVPKIFAGIAN